MTRLNLGKLFCFIYLFFIQKAPILFYEFCFIFAKWNSYKQACVPDTHKPKGIMYIEWEKRS